MTRRVTVVPHTHWDREWYLPFQTFRLRLVAALDGLLADLDADPSYRHFLLDGQMAAVDDFLAVRPEAEAALRRHNAAGRLAMGPWYTLPDEFLVSGETLVRDLQLGLSRAARFGGAMEVGYLPDMFGHVAQMPQLLRLFGLDHAVVWRGVPAAVDRTGFWWQAPDGSTVRAEYLPTGYGNGADMPADPQALLDRIRAWEAEHAHLLADGPILWMNGSDHHAPQPFVGRVVAEASDLAGDELDVTVGSLAAYLAAAPTEGLPAWDGELRSGARANLLAGVTSNRVDVKRAAARAELALERRAEPLLALFADPEAWPGALLDDAWLAMVRNAAHDSVCACSHDDVVAAVLHRYAEATHIAEGLAAEGVRWAAARTSGHGPMAVNSVARTRSGLVELSLFGDTAPEGTQLLEARPALDPIATLPASSAATVLAEIVGWSPGLGGVRYELADDGHVEVTLLADGTVGEPAERSTVAARIAGLAAAPDTPVRAWLRRAPSAVVLARVADVPGFGWRSWQPGPLDVVSARATDHGLHNGLVTVTVDPADGTWALDGHGGLGRLVDGGDVGDTYTWCPPEPDTLVDRPRAVTVRTVETGPLRAALEVTARYGWPSRSTPGGRSADLDDVAVTTRLELRAGEAWVRVEHGLDHRTHDHRLRVHFPLPTPATWSTAECAFATVRRGLVAEGGPTEPGCPTHPARRFVGAGGLTVVHEGVTEYELVDLRPDGAHELALTVLRATGMLSRGPMPTRPLPAGPLQALRGAQVPGRVVMRYAVATAPVDPYAMADDVLVPLLAAYGAGLGDRPAVHAELVVEGAEVSSLRRAGGGLELRVFNPGPDPADVRLPGRSGWLVDLRDRPLEPVQGGITLRPWGIATVRLT